MGKTTDFDSVFRGSNPLSSASCDHGVYTVILLQLLYKSEFF